nr:hypothetical protein [Tanacetum cinerariifolium]
DELAHTYAYGSTAHEVSSSSSGSHRQAFLRHNAGGDGVGSSLRGDQVHLGCVGKEANLTEKLAAMEKERDDLMDKNREREEWIKQLEADIAFKISSLTEAERAASTLKGDLERLTVDLSHAEIIRHNYVWRLLPTVFQWLLSSDEYKKSLASCVSGNIRHLAIGAWTHPKHLAFRVIYVTWPLALGLIRGVEHLLG